MDTKALDWINGSWKDSPYAKTLPGIGFGVDQDGLYGFQCKDFVNAYAIFLGKSFTPGNAIVLAEEAQTGWERIYNISAAQVGDVFVKDYISNGINYGHTGIIQSLAIGGFYSIDQNWIRSSLEHGSPPARVFHSFAEVRCYLRLEGDTMDATKLQTTIDALTKQRDDVAQKLIDQEKATTAVTAQRDDVANKLIASEIALEAAKKGLTLENVIQWLQDNYKKG